MQKPECTKGGKQRPPPARHGIRICTMQKLHIYSKGKKLYRHDNYYLTEKQVDSIFSLAEKAYEDGCPLNRFFTVHLKGTGEYKDPQKFITGLMEHSRKWLKRRGLPVCYVWVLENGQYKGVHVHFLIHIPEGFQVRFKRSMRAWVSFEWTKTSVRVEGVKYPPLGELNEHSPIYGVLKYHGKGIQPSVAHLFNIMPKYQGAIIGRRCGFSRMTA